MIVCKPKSSVQFVLWGIMLFTYGLTFFLFGKIVSGGISTFLLVIAMIVLVISILLTVKVLTGYRILAIDPAQGKVWVKYIFRTYRFDIQALSAWEEVLIKTFNNQVFKQVDVFFGEQKVSFSEQEHLGYADLLKFLKKQGKQKNNSLRR